MAWGTRIKRVAKRVAKRVVKSMRKILTTSSSASQRDINEPREAPAPATPIQLPLGPPRAFLGRADYTAQEIAQLFLTIHKTGPTIEHIQALNVGSITEVALEQLIPKDHLPPLSWLEDPSTTGGSNVFPAPLPSKIRLSNGAVVPGHDVYFPRVKELLVDNEDAFRYIDRQPASPSRPAVRIAQFRRFWDGLSQMADYWDTSLDQYTSSTADTVEGAMKVGQSPTESASVKEGGEGSQGTQKQSYTGRRLGTGKDMPSKYRDDTIFSFIETIAFAFRCRVEKPRMEPKIKLHNLFIPLAQTATVYRTSKDGQIARRGIMEGPLMGIQCSNQTIFHRPEEVPGQGQGETANLLREIGLMLSIAQKRSREGQKEPEPTEGQWWVSKPRWGGKAGGEIGVSEEIQESKEMDSDFGLAFLKERNDERRAKGESSKAGKMAEERLPRRSTREESESSNKGRKRTKRSNAMDNWKNLQSVPSTWDKHIIYQRVGKDKRSAFDDVSPTKFTPNPATKPLTSSQIYLISSLNHHISIVHVSVHPEYSSYLNVTAPQPDFVPAQQPWYHLSVRRSRWFDLLVAADRAEAMRGVWGAMGYLMRDLGDNGP